MNVVQKAKDLLGMGSSEEEEPPEPPGSADSAESEE
jgi:hypothetical protein